MIKNHMLIIRLPINSDVSNYSVENLRIVL